MRIITGKFGGRILNTVTGKGYRPAMSKTRESLFSIIESLGINWDNISVMDLFAGSGSLAFESLSRGVQKATLVENDDNAVKNIEKNCNLLGVNDFCQVINKDVIHYLKSSHSDSYNIVFVDPPYGLNILPKVLYLLSHKNWLVEGGLVIAEMEKSIDVPKMDNGNLIKERIFGQTRICIWEII